MGEIRLLDCTLRDGGDINDWNFGEQVIKDTIKKLEKSHVDIIEIGFFKDEPYEKNRTIYDDINQLSKQIIPKKEKIAYAAVIEMLSPFPVSQIAQCSEETVDMIRVIVQKSLLKESFEYCKYIVEKGYKLLVQPACVNQFSYDEFIEMLDLFNAINPWAFYVADSWGTQNAKQLLTYILLADKHLKPGIAIGYHGHNNMQQVFGVAKALCEEGLDRDICIDASVDGIGRDAGNLDSTIIAEYLNGKFEKQYHLSYFFYLSEKYIKSMFALQPWGYTMPYFLAAIRNCNPKYATYYDFELHLPVDNIERILNIISEEDKIVYTKNKAKKYLDIYLKQFWNKKLGIVILTCNRPERVKYYINRFSSIYASHGVDLIIYDSSDNNETKFAVEDCIQRGNNHLIYRQYVGIYDGKSLDTKVIDAYREYCDKYEYVWLCRDGLIVNFDDINTKLKSILSSDHDIVVVDSYFRTEKGVKGTKIYDDCRELLKDQCIRMVTLGTVIFSSNFVKKLIAECPVDHTNYTLWQAIAPFHYIASKPVKAISFYDNVFIYHPIRIRASFWNKSGNAVWQWGERWHDIVSSLPEVYSEEKEALFKIRMVDFDPFGTTQLFIMKANGGLKVSTVIKNKKYLKHVTDKAYWKIAIISLLPLPSALIIKAVEDEESFTSKIVRGCFRGLRGIYRLCKPKHEQPKSSEIHRFRQLLRKLKQRLLPPSSKSFHTKTDHISNQISFANFQTSNLYKYIEGVNRVQEQRFWISINKDGETLEETKKNYFLNMPIGDPSTRNIQLIIKNLIKNFAEICNENNLQYWVWGGTLLGTIRHNGFVPWDDDADVAMIREDFNKLRQILKDTNSRYQFRYYYDLGHPTWTAQIPKLIDTETNIPIFLDIFPFDWTNSETFDDAENEYNQARSAIEGDINKCIKKYSLRKYESEPVEKGIEKELNEIFDSHTRAVLKDGTHLRWGADMHKAHIGYMEKDWVFPIKKHIFEDIEVSIPNRSLNCLHMLYNDYYSFPSDAYSNFHSTFFGYDKLQEEIKEYIKENHLK